MLNGYASQAYGFVIIDPSPQNGFNGRIKAESLEAYIPVMRHKCETYGRKLEEDKAFYQAQMGSSVENVYFYSCIVTPQYNVRDNYGAGSDPKNSKNTYIAPAQTSLGSPIDSSLNLNTVKNKCQELGFKPKTEKFGKCVLELTR